MLVDNSCDISTECHHAVIQSRRRLHQVLLLMLSLWYVYCFAEEFEDEELFPEDALSNHTDMVDNEPVINEAKRKFIR